jgi:Esterase/lipase
LLPSRRTRSAAATFPRKNCGKDLDQLRKEHIFTSDIGRGLNRLYRAADAGDWYYPLYSEAECAEDAARKGVSLVKMLSDDPKADERPFILLVPGGGFVNVWNLTEGWPIAAQFNDLGYHTFILTYQVEGEENLLEKNMEDFARALNLIRDHADSFHVRNTRYITCGFSAGGYLVCLWNTGMGFVAHGLPQPAATIPVYPVVSLKRRIRYGSSDPAGAIRLYGCPLEKAAEKDFEIPEHVEHFPPCAIFLAAGDELVNPENSKMLARSLEARGIPCLLEIGPEGGHGFADGNGMCMAGWTERAVRWIEESDRA